MEGGKIVPPHLGQVTPSAASSWVPCIIINAMYGGSSRSQVTKPQGVTAFLGKWSSTAFSSCLTDRVRIGEGPVPRFVGEVLALDARGARLADVLHLVIVDEAEQMILRES